MRPKTGAPRMFCTEMEGNFTLFMKHCCLLRIPRTREMLRKDIVHFTQYKNMTVDKMGEDGPGN